MLLSLLSHSTSWLDVYIGSRLIMGMADDYNT